MTLDLAPKYSSTLQIQDNLATISEALSDLVQSTGTSVVNHLSRTTVGQRLPIDWFTAYLDPEFELILKRIRQIFEDHSDDPDTCVPTTYALETGLSFLFTALHILSSAKLPFPRATVAADEDGMLYIYWRRPEKKVHLNVPPAATGNVSIYHRIGEDYGLEQDVQPYDLAQWIEWFTDESADN